MEEMEKGRIIALDVGDKRIGIAVSDPTCTIAYPLETYKRKNERRDLEYIKELYSRLEADKIIIGLPLLLDGAEGTQAKKVKVFAEKLRAMGLKIEFIDERFSTDEADDLLKEKGQGWKERKSKRDAVAAAIILNNYIKE